MLLLLTADTGAQHRVQRRCDITYDSPPTMHKMKVCGVPNRSQRLSLLSISDLRYFGGQLLCFRRGRFYVLCTRTLTLFLYYMYPYILHTTIYHDDSIIKCHVRVFECLSSSVGVGVCCSHRLIDRRRIENRRYAVCMSYAYVMYDMNVMRECAK